MNKRFFLVFIITLLLIIGSRTADSQQSPSPQQGQPYKTITAVSLKTLMDDNTLMVVVDARTEKEYTQGHIPGSINVNPEKFNYIAGYLPKDKSILIVFYCRGAT